VVVLAVDHGEKRIGVAISDSTGAIARPLAIIAHVSRAEDADRVLELADRHQAASIIIGESTDENGEPNLAGRRARRFAGELGRKTELPVILWDESMSSQDAIQIQIAAGASRKKRQTEIDALAAAVILQSYLDATERPAAQ
jgi:putative Holliday junction resolvase